MGVETDWTSSKVEIAQGRTVLEIIARRKSSDDFLYDHYLFRARLIACDGTVTAERTFGLDGAGIWSVYGPYWDMWDKDEYSDCPYQSKQLTCNPGNLPKFCGDAFNTHVRLDHPYLNETRLLKEEIPEESPFLVETAGHRISREDLFGFNGASCCYLVRDFKAEKPVEKVQFLFQADCPFVCYLDGRRLSSCGRHENPGTAYTAAPLIDLTGNLQRIVIKLMTRLEHFQCGLNFFRPVEIRTHAISPYVSGIATKLPEMIKK